ncbi:DUF2760 domain-containing protein [Tautonia sp. JC769]|uniref:DUF2760 domain-containing protein n=1 Tax=Tautonia sp. JC769 TaxID=3232135 RepID=UPI00345876DE
MNRFLLSFRAFWDVLTDRERADRVALALEPPTAAGPDLRILALLQRDGRLIDFLQEDLEGFPDDQIGAAVRDIHRGCRKALAEYLDIQPVLAREEGDSLSVDAEFDPAAIRLLGNVSGNPPYQGTLKHHGWRVTAARLPNIPAARDESTVLAPAEIEV